VPHCERYNTAEHFSAMQNKGQHRRRCPVFIKTIDFTPIKDLKLLVLSQNRD
jgi:hypothetical protein